MDFANHIFVATDFSDASMKAVQAAAKLAAQLGAKVTLFHVFDPDPLVPPGAIPNPSEFREKISTEMTAAVHKKLAELRVQELGSVSDVDTVVATDRSAAHSICEHAKEADADLLVVATHGRTGLSHLLIGSVAERVVRHAHCPVLAVRASK
jgi:nucleotide-binding universal stress UspA family protein